MNGSCRAAEKLFWLLPCIVWFKPAALARMVWSAGSPPGARAAGFADHQRAWQATDAMVPFAGDQPHELPAGLATELLQVHVDAGERRPRRFRHDLPIVEADQRDRVGHADAALAERIRHPAGDLVVAAEDRIGRHAAAAEKLRHALAAPALGPHAGEIEAV